MSSPKPPNKRLSTVIKKELLPHAKPGGVFRVVDRDHVHFPASENDGTRKFKGSRWAIVVQEESLCRSTAIKTVLVVPCSTGEGGGTSADLKVPSGEPGFTGESWAYTSLVQPIVKGALEEHTGDLSPEFLTVVQDKIATLIPKQKLPDIIEEIPAEEEDVFPDENDMKKKKKKKKT